MSYVIDVLEGKKEAKKGFAEAAYIILKSNIVIRYIFYIGLSLFLIFILFIPYESLSEEQNLHGILGLIFIFAPIIFVTFLERQAIKFRKKHNLSIYIGVHKEVRDINDRLERERNTIVVNSNEVDKSDIGYWHSLLEKGAITKEEYEVKKAELMQIVEN